MSTQTAYHRDTTGQTLYAFPYGQALADWDTYKVQLVETPAASENYQADLDDAIDTDWRIFAGATQPASLADALYYSIALDPVVSEVLPATRDDLLEIVRGQADLAGGGFATQKPYILAEHEWGTTDPTCMLTTGDAVAQVGDTVLKWLNAAKTITAVAVGTPKLVHRAGQKYPSIFVNGASGFVVDWVDGLDANPLDLNIPTGAFAAVYRRTATDGSYGTIAGLSSTNSTGTRITWVNRQLDETRIQCLTGMQHGGASLRTWDGISGGRINCQAAHVWASDGTNYSTLNPLQLSGNVAGTDDGVWLNKYGSFDRHVTTFGFLRNTTDSQFLTGDLQYIAWYTGDAIPGEILKENRYYYPAPEMQMLGDSRVNNDEIFQANSDFDGGLFLGELGIGGASILDMVGQIDAAAAGGYTLKNVALFVGVNDVLGGATAREMVADMETVLEHLFTVEPSAEALIFNELPSDTSLSINPPMNEVQQDYSLAISDIARRYDERVIVVDTMTPLRDAGGDGMSVADSTDGIHPTLAGYTKIWPNVLAARQTSRYSTEARTLSGVVRLLEADVISSGATTGFNSDDRVDLAMVLTQIAQTQDNQAAQDLLAIAIAQLTLRKDAAVATDQSTTLGLINADGGSGAGAFGPVSDSQEAIADSGGSGSGVYTMTLTIQNVSAEALQGARVSIAGTALVATSESDGTVTFAVDDGTYSVVVSPPSGYDTPAATEVIVSGANKAQTITLVASSGDGSIPWVG